MHKSTPRSPEQASRMWVFLNRIFLQVGVVSTTPNPQAGGPPLVGCPRQLIQFIRSYPPYRRPFLYPQPEDAPCRGDRDPLDGWHRSHKINTVHINVALPSMSRNPKRQFNFRFSLSVVYVPSISSVVHFSYIFKCFEPCIVIYLYNKDQQNAQFLH